MKYITVKSPAESSYIEKRSEFIGHISPAETNEDAINFINHIKENNRKARHNVYAISFATETSQDILTTENLREQREYLFWKFCAKTI